MRIFLLGLLWMLGSQAYAQEIEARAYSNAPIGINFASLGIGQASSSSYKLTTEAAGFTRIFDAWGQSGKITIVLPYAELSGTGNPGSQTLNASSEGLSDPLIKASVNLYGAPALTLDQFKNYQQDLIIGASLAASIPWGQYNNQQLLNVGANRWFVQPGLGASKAIGPWRLELAGAATLFTSNNRFLGSNTLTQNPIYSTQTHAIYYFPNTAWLSADASYYFGGQTFVNGTPVGGPQENWRFGATFSYPIDTRNSIRVYGSTGAYSRTNNSYDLIGISWQYRWGAGM